MNTIKLTKLFFIVQVCINITAFAVEVPNALLKFFSEDNLCVSEKSSFVGFHQSGNNINNPKYISSINGNVYVYDVTSVQEVGRAQTQSDSWVTFYKVNLTYQQNKLEMKIGLPYEKFKIFDATVDGEVIIKNGLNLKNNTPMPVYSMCRLGGNVRRDFDEIAIKGKIEEKYDPFTDTKRLANLINEAIKIKDHESICVNGNLYLNALSEKGQSDKNFEKTRDQSCNIIRSNKCDKFRVAVSQCKSAIDYASCMDRSNFYKMDRDILDFQCKFTK